MPRTILQAEAGEIRVSQRLGIGDIPAIIEAIRALAEMIKKCRENRQTRRSWSEIKRDGASRVSKARVFARVRRRLGSDRLEELGGRDFTDYLCDRYRTRPVVELEPIVAEATA